MQIYFSLLLCFAFSIMHCSGASDMAKPDGFNFYKDYLRGKQDEISVIPELDGERVLYFYRTPAAFLQPDPFADQEFHKRTTHTFKNHMLSRDSVASDGGGRGDGIDLQKRVSKAALSWILAHKHRLHADSGNQLEDVGIETNLPLHDTDSIL